MPAMSAIDDYATGYRTRDSKQQFFYFYFLNIWQAKNFEFLVDFFQDRFLRKKPRNKKPCLIYVRT